MASTTFMSGNQSFSEANSSWASLIVDQVQSTLEEEDYTNFPEFNVEGGDHSTPLKRPGVSTKHVDMRTFEQILQVMIQQGAALDSLREELDQYRQECKQELDHRDARLRLAEKEIRSLREDKESAIAELQELEEELGELKASEELTITDVMAKEEHDRIVRRIQDDARARIESVEAEKSHLTVQLSRFQIQVAQLKNQLDDRSYPDEVIEELTKTLKYNIIETCKNVDVEAQAVKQELAATREELLKRDGEVEELKSTLDDLHNEYDTVLERLAIAESMQSQVESANKRLSETEHDLQRTIESGEVKLKEVTQELQAQINNLTASLEKAKADTATEVDLRNELEKSAGEVKAKYLEANGKLEAELEVAKKRIAELEATVQREQAEASAARKQIDELQEALNQADKAHKDAIRDNEQIRLKHAEAETNRAEDLERKVMELEEETERVHMLESDLKKTQAQLAQAMESINLAQDQASKHLEETSQVKAEIAELRTENEQLIAARRQMAAIYGLPAEPIVSPRHTPTTPARRSSQSLSPSTSSGPVQWSDFPLPPQKRRKTSKRPATEGGTSGAAAAGSSPADAILLEETDEGMTAPSTPTSKEKNGFYSDIPKYLIDVYAMFTKVVTWTDESDRPACGFCRLHNWCNDKDLHAPLLFDPSQYPITFWQHCLMRHKDALRPDIEAWLKVEGQKLTTLDVSQPGDASAVLAKTVSWKKAEEDQYVCGLCEMEKKRRKHDTLNFDPIAEPAVFWTHCQQEHVPFWKSVS